MAEASQEPVSWALSEEENRLCRQIHALKCERNKHSHHCQGTITIDRRSVTLNCRICVHARSRLI